MRVNKVLLDCFLVAVGIVGTVFLLNCSDTATPPEPTPITRPTVHISLQHGYDPCIEDIPVTMKSAALYFSEEMDMDSVASHVEVQPAIAFSTNPGLSTFYLNFMECIALEKTLPHLV